MCFKLRAVGLIEIGYTKSKSMMFIIFILLALCKLRSDWMDAHSDPGP